MNQYEIIAQAGRLAQLARANGLVLTISQQPLLPLAMGNHADLCEVRPLRGESGPPVRADSNDRAEFEAWVCRRWKCTVVPRDFREDKDTFGEYVDGIVEMAWCAWQASLGLSR